VTSIGSSVGTASRRYTMTSACHSIVSQVQDKINLEELPVFRLCLNAPSRISSDGARDT